MLLCCRRVPASFWARDEPPSLDLCTKYPKYPPQHCTSQPGTLAPAAGCAVQPEHPTSGTGAPNALTPKHYKNSTVAAAARKGREQKKGKRARAVLKPRCCQGSNSPSREIASTYWATTPGKPCMKSKKDTMTDPTQRGQICDIRPTTDERHQGRNVVDQPNSSPDA